jgi:hypothetical protein
LPDFISTAVNGHDEVAVIARLAHGRKQKRAKKFPEQQSDGTVSILHNHQAGEFSRLKNHTVAGSHGMAGPADQINHHGTGRIADSAGLGNPLFSAALFQATGNFPPGPSTGSSCNREQCHNTISHQSPVDIETQLN